MTHKHREQGDDEYATPPGLWRPLARAVGGFDLDPHSVALAQRDMDVTVDEPARLPERDGQYGLEAYTDGGDGHD